MINKKEKTQAVRKKIKEKLQLTYKISLNEEQKKAKGLIYENTITILTGSAGSGKTQVAVLTALDMLFKEQIEKIFITRPNITKEDYGFLPGDLKEKMDPLLIPIYDCLYNAYEKEKIDKLFAEEKIIIAPVGFMRGRTFTNAVLIIDEAQNVDDTSMEMCVTRIGKNGKIVICGDGRQVDLKSQKLSGLPFLISLIGKVNKLAQIRLESNHRDDIVAELIKCYEERDSLVQFKSMVKVS